MASAESVTPELPFLDGPYERWLPVVGFEGLYEVSSLGHIRSMCWPGKCNWLEPRILKTRPNKYGHLAVNLYKDKRQRTRTVHLIVAEAFHGPRPPGMWCCHGPGGKTDNRAVNLSWDTKAKNMGPDRVRDGTDFRGERSPQVKLTAADVASIRQRGLAGASGKALAAEFGVGAGTISYIQTGRNRRYDGEPALARRPRRWKLTREQVASILERHAIGGASYPELAAQFGVTRERIGQIVRAAAAGEFLAPIV